MDGHLGEDERMRKEETRKEKRKESREIWG
jgi:hypothetical protein